MSNSTGVHSPISEDALEESPFEEPAVADSVSVEKTDAAIPLPGLADAQPECVAGIAESPNDAALIAPASRAVESQERPAGQLREESANFWLRHSDQLFVGCLVVVALGLMVVHWVRLSHWGTQPVEIERLESQWYQYRIDVNTATWVEWAQLPGIGETRARRIVEDRERNGPFLSIRDVQRVKGIGPKTIAKMRPGLRIGSAKDESP